MKFVVVLRIYVVHFTFELLVKCVVVFSRLLVKLTKMAPLDWDQLMNLDVEKLQEDTSLADGLYDVLSDVIFF